MGLELKRIEKEIKLNKRNVCIQFDHLVRVVLVCVALYMRGFVTKAYIPLQHKTPRIGVRVEQYPQRENFALGIPTCWYLKSLTEPTPTLNFALPPTPTSMSRWNIGRVGSLTQGAGVGHVYFILFVSISFALGGQRKHSFSLEYGL